MSYNRPIEQQLEDALASTSLGFSFARLRRRLGHEVRLSSIAFALEHQAADKRFVLNHLVYWALTPVPRQPSPDHSPEVHKGQSTDGPPVIGNPALFCPVWEPEFAQRLWRKGLAIIQQYPAEGYYLDIALVTDDGRVRRPLLHRQGEMLFRGVATPVRVVRPFEMRGTNRIQWDGTAIEVRQSRTSRTPVAKSLENWLRKQARTDIETHLNAITARVGRKPNHVYVMAQRTKWGNCSRLKNLSFSWRLIMVPPMVLKYLVTHEAVHHAIPDHSSRFWLTVQSLCPETERAKQWLSRHGERLPMGLDEAFKRT